MVVIRELRSGSPLYRLRGAPLGHRGQFALLIELGMPMGILVIASVATLEGAGHGSLLFQVAPEPGGLPGYSQPSPASRP